MRTIRRFRAAHPEVVVRADGLTSLRILDGLRAGLLAAGIVRGPVADPGRLDVGAAGPGARRSRRRAAGASAGGGGRGRRRRPRRRAGARSSIGPMRRRPTTRSRRTAPRPEPGRGGSRTPRSRSSGCSTRWPSGPGSDGSTRGRPSRPPVASTWPCGRCARWRCSTSSAPCGGPATRRTRSLRSSTQPALRLPR